MIAAYPGDSIRKKIARAMAYIRVRKLFEATGRIGRATVVALAGDEGADAGVVRAMGIAGHPELVTLVDTERPGLERGAAKWPGVNIFCGWLHDAKLPDRVDLAVLDFCGSLDSEMARLGVTSLRGRLGIGSV